MRLFLVHINRHNEDPLLLSRSIKRRITVRDLVTYTTAHPHPNYFTPKAVQPLQLLHYFFGA